jgi:hypothetical protein
MGLLPLLPAFVFPPAEQVRQVCGMQIPGSLAPPAKNVAAFKLHRDLTDRCFKIVQWFSLASGLIVAAPKTRNAGLIAPTVMLILVLSYWPGW